jgi:hypothetical protein
MFGSVKHLKFCFSGKSGDTLELDSIRFTPDGSKTAKRLYVPHFERVVTPFDWFSALWMQILSWFVK